MTIWNKILIALVVIAGAVFCYMAARALKTQQYWLAAAERMEKRLEAAKKENAALRDGTGEPAGAASIKALKLEIHKLLVDRGRVWQRCAVQTVDPQTGQVAVEIAAPLPHGIADKAVLHAFEDAGFEKGGRYIGEFRVTGVADKRLEMQPTHTMSPRELNRLGKTKEKGTWTLYDVLPVDNNEVFADLKEDELRALVPEAYLAEYLRDGKPAQKSDPPERVVNGKYQRPLRDFGVLLRDAQRRRTELDDLITSADRDLKHLKDAVADAERHVQFHQQTIATLKKELAEAGRQRDAAGTLRAELEKSLAAVEKMVDTGIATNRATAAEIAKLQLDASRRIDQRTSTMAGAGPAGN